MKRLITRRVYAVIDHRTGKAAAIRECISLMEQVITIVSGGTPPAVLAVASKMDLSNGLGLTLWADLINRVTKPPVDVSVGSHRTMTWLNQRIATPDGADYASLNASVYWEVGEHVSVYLEGTAEGMRLCRTNALWRPANAQYHEVTVDPLPLELAIAQAAEHVC